MQKDALPDYVSCPGETLQEILIECAMSHTELAMRMKRPVKTIREMMQGKAKITPGMALQLERVLRIPASFWLKREREYRDYLARTSRLSRLCVWVSCRVAGVVWHLAKMRSHQG